MKFLPLLLAVLTVPALAVSDTQTDWSGGDGVPGPVTYWGDTYSTAAGISSMFIPGHLTLAVESITTEEYIVSDMASELGSPAADVDGDGDLDMLHADHYQELFYWSENTDGTGTSWTYHALDSLAHNAGVIYPCDLDGDGDIDAIGASSMGTNFGISWFENLNGVGTSWGEHSIDPGYYFTDALGAGDFDDDGDTDVLACSFWDSNIRWWENTDGTGAVWTEHYIFEGYDKASDIHAVDMDNDGDLDVLAASQLGHSASWMENDGTGQGWTEHTVGTLLYNNCAYPVDMDEDGDIDVIGSGADGTIWWENTNGLGTTWTEHNCNLSTGAKYAYPGDLDGDGDLDIAICFSSGEIGWSQNTDGLGTSWTYHSVASYYSTNNLYLADIDGDGILDISSSSYDTSVDVANTAWWKFLEYTSSGELYSSILNTECLPLWGDIAWTDNLPDGTELDVELRGGSDPGAMGSWFEFTEPGPIPEYLDYLPYLQYRITMASSSQFTPALQDITVDWEEYTGTAEGHESGIPFWGFAPLENPSQAGILTLNVSAATAGPVGLRVYDLSGRIMAETTITAVTGTQEVLFEGLPQGICFCVMEADGFTATQRVVLIP